MLLSHDATLPGLAQESGLMCCLSSTGPAVRLDGGKIIFLLGLGASL